MTENRKKHFVFFLSIFPIQHRHLKLRWSSFDCRVHTDFVSEYKCRVVQPMRSALNVELNLLQELRSIKVYTLISTKPPSGVTYRKLFDNSLDGCRVISQLSQKGITSKIYASVIKSSNQPKMCPIKKVSSAHSRSIIFLLNTSCIIGFDLLS